MRLTEEVLRSALATTGAERRDARTRALRLSTELQRLVVHASAQGMADAEIVRLTGADKQTIRKWLGK